MIPPNRIWQCKSGHVICETCKGCSAHFFSFTVLEFIVLYPKKRIFTLLMCGDPDPDHFRTGFMEFRRYGIRPKYLLKYIRFTLGIGGNSMEFLNEKFDGILGIPCTELLISLLLYRVVQYS
jgi:hypothetical protein